MARYYCSGCGHERPRSVNGLCIKCSQRAHIAELEGEIEQLLGLLPLRKRALYKARFPRALRPEDFPEDSEVVRLRRCVRALENRRDHLVEMARDMCFNDPAYNNKRLDYSQGEWRWAEAIWRG